MSKSIYFNGQPIFSHLLSLLSRDKIEQIAAEGDYDRYTKKFDAYTHLVTLLFAVLKGHDSLREIVIGLLGETHKLGHLGIMYVARRSTLAEANERRSAEFFEKVYYGLFERVKPFLLDSRNKRQKDLFIIDSTTISLFSDIFKGVGRTPASGRRKGGVKVHTVLRANEEPPYQLNITDASKHDSQYMNMLESVPKGSTIAMDRGYTNYAFFRKATQNGVTYVTKAKKNMVYKTLMLYRETANSPQKQEYEVRTIVFGEKKREGQEEAPLIRARLITYQERGAKDPIRLLTNDFDSEATDIALIYTHRWQIEMHYKQLKQNFQLHYFFGDSRNAIRTQIWVTLIANLLLMYVKARTRRKWSFSNLVSVIRHTLMYYVNLDHFLEEPEKALIEFNKSQQNAPPRRGLFD